MRITRVMAVALWVVPGQGTVAQTVSAPSGPAELPPESFSGAQYVDSAGCVFLRAGLNDQVKWALRVTQARTPICGKLPSFVQRAPAAALTVEPPAPPEPPVQPAPPEQPVAEAGQTGGSTLAAEAPPAATSPPEAAIVPVEAPASGECQPDAPLPVRVALASGGAVVLCLSEDAQLAPGTTVARFEGTRAFSPPDAASGTSVCPETAEVMRYLPLSTGGATQLCTRVDGSLTGITLPQVKKASPEPAATPAKGRFVQVGLFAQAENAARTRDRLAAIGLPAEAGPLTRGGKRYISVVAGPFAGAQQAAAALAKIRAAGFPDAFLR